MLISSSLFGKSQEFLLFLVAFVFGFGWAELYVPFIVCYVIIFNNKSLSLNFNPMCWLNYLLAIFFVLFTYLPGLEIMYVNSPIGTFIVVLFLVAFIIPIFNIVSLECFIKLLLVFLFGLFVYVTSVVLYSILTDPFSYSKGSLVSPFIKDLRYNPAAFSNYLTLVFCGYFYSLLIEKRLMMRFFSIIVLLLSVFMAISLAGRTFFLLASFFSVILLLKFSSVRIYIYLMGLSVALFIFIYYSGSGFFDFGETLFVKFDRGLESTRYDLWINALQEIPGHPFGGFDVDQNIEEIHSFHNILFDAARLGGWIPLFLISAIFALNPMIGFFVKKSSNHVFFLRIFLCVLMLSMMQDVILEGTYKFLVLYSLINVLIFKFAFGAKYFHHKVLISK